VTIVVDTSAIIAILFREPERDRFRHLLEATPAVISAGNLIELLRVVMRRTPHLVRDARDVLAALGVAIAAVDEAQVALAEEGQARFGLGRGAPPAVLNFGDLFAYALARQLDAPLLFKGDDFSRTDVQAAAWPGAR
jgi:ribonuclease VapC